MRQIAEFVAVLACGLFAGAAVYVSLVEHPARMACGVEIAAAEFPPSYHRGTIMQVTLAAVCLLSSIAAWLAGATFWWVVAGVLQVSVIPFTLIVILPTNKQLADDPDSCSPSRCASVHLSSGPRPIFSEPYHEHGVREQPPARRSPRVCHESENPNRWKSRWW